MSDITLVEAERADGNKCFRENKFFDACRNYEIAISHCPESEKSLLSLLYCNLSAAQLQIEKTNEATDSANKAIEYDSGNAKAHYRLALALKYSLDFKGSYKEMLAAAKLDQNNKFLRNQLDIAKKLFVQSEYRSGLSSDNLAQMAQEPAPEKEADKTPIPEFNVEYARKLMVDMTNSILPPKAVVLEMLRRMSDINKAMDNIVMVKRPGIIHVVGDTHGQYQDLRHIFDLYGEPSSENPYLFNGDYVDRGSMGTEIVLALFAWKLAIPDSIYMNRGNHETNMMNQMYGFERECTEKYSKAVFETFSKFFDTMPLGHILNDQVLVVHGGLFSDQTVDIAALQSKDRFGQPPESGPLNDILWSDPMEENGFAPSPRGVTRTFGPDVTQQFLDRNNLSLLIRSHQVQENGYGVMHNGKCITVFSAPNYIGQMGNKGAVVKLTFAEDGMLEKKEFEQFSAQPIPPKYPPMKYATFGRFF